MNRFGSHPKHENHPLYEGPPPQGLSEVRRVGSFFWIFSHRSAAGVPRWGRRQSSYQMESVVTIPASYLNTTIFIGKPNFIYSVSHLVPRISLCGGCDRDGDAGKCRIPKERYENFFLSISPEPKKGIRHHCVKHRGGTGGLALSPPLS